ncbi:MAG: hypothetical protein GX890_04005 [Firmicutes bacterium]|nr:hypothetical protein [Bacillota bacterium]HPU01885.1 hypothetical protein [Bacillota bacterium]
MIVSGRKISLDLPLISSRSNPSRTILTLSVSNFPAAAAPPGLPDLLKKYLGKNKKAAVKDNSASASVITATLVASLSLRFLIVATFLIILT